VRLGETFAFLFAGEVIATSALFARIKNKVKTNKVGGEGFDFDSARVKIPPLGEKKNETLDDEIETIPAAVWTCRPLSR